MRTVIVVLPTFSANFLANLETCVSIAVAASASNAPFRSPPFAAVVTLSSTGRSNVTVAGSLNFSPFNFAMLSISVSDLPIPSWSNLYPREPITKSNSDCLSASVFLVLVKNSVIRVLIDALSSTALLPSAAAFNSAAVDLSVGIDPLPRFSLAFLVSLASLASLAFLNLIVFSKVSLANISARVSTANGDGFLPVVLVGGLGSTPERPNGSRPSAAVPSAPFVASAGLETALLGFAPTSRLLSETLSLPDFESAFLVLTSGFSSFAFFVLVLANGKSNCASGVASSSRFIFVFVATEVFLFSARVTNCFRTSVSLKSLPITRLRIGAASGTPSLSNNAVSIILGSTVGSAVVSCTGAVPKSRLRPNVGSDACVSSTGLGATFLSIVS